MTKETTKQDSGSTAVHSFRFYINSTDIIEILAGRVKLTHSLILLTSGRLVQIEPISTISEKVIREATYQISDSLL